MIGKVFTVVFALSLSGVLLAVCESPPLNNTSASKSEENQDKTLPQLCKSIHKCKDISVMLELIGKMREYLFDKSRAIAENKIQPPSAVSNFWESLNFLSQKRACLRQVDAIMELEPILRETQKVCSQGHLDKMEAYRKKHVPGYSFAARPKITHSFFVLYAGQVSVVCKRNLKRSLEAAEQQLIGTKDFEQISLFLKPPISCDPSHLTAVNEEDSTEQSATDSMINLEQQIDKTDRSAADQASPQQLPQPGAAAAESQVKIDKEKLRCRALNALSEIKSIDQLVAMLGQDIQLNTKEELKNANSGLDKLGDAFERDMPASVRENLDRLHEICYKFERIYSHNIMSIVRLSQMGYDPSFPQFEVTCLENTMIQRWFGITVICSSLLKDGRAKLEDSSRTRVRDHDAELKSMIQSPIDSKLTIGKYLPSRLSKLSSDFVKNMKKKLHIEDDSDLSKSLVKIGRYIAIALAMTVSLLSAAWNKL